MRIFIAVSVLLFSSLPFAQTSIAQDSGDLSFPYNALVLRDQAPVRSGPGTVHYATDKLRQGQTVEVYRHDPGGWCAIRPPAGAFSLIPESAIELVEDNVGKIANGSAQAWVGTRLGSVDSPLWQIKLKEDELVEILGEVSWPNPEGHSTIWFQIAPPAGEFRWIQIADLRLPDDSTDLERLQSPERGRIAVATGIEDIPSPAPQTIASPLATATPANEVYEPPRDVQPQLPAKRLATPNAGVATRHHSKTTRSLENTIPDRPTTSVNSGWRRAKSQLEKDASIGQHVSNERPNEFTAPAVPDNGFQFGDVEQVVDDRATRVRGSFEAIDDSQFTRVVAANMEISEPQDRLASKDDTWNIAPDRRPKSVTPSVVATGPLSSQLRSLELSLTNEMLKQPVEWKLGELLLRAESMRDSAQNPTDTQQANRLITKIRNCQTIRASYRKAYNNSPTSNAGSDRSLRGPIGSGVDPSVELGTNYDAHGTLNELVRDKGSVKSTYVLQDSKGQITHHIAPAPGVNLHRYLGSKVGIVGRRGFHQRLNLDHVTAERVVEIRKLR